MSDIFWDLVMKLMVLFVICSGRGTDTQWNMFQQVNILYYFLVTIQHRVLFLYVNKI